MPLDSKKIRLLREQHNLTLQEAATRAGMMRRQLWHRIEAGKHPTVTSETLLAMSRVLGVTMDELMDTAPKRPGRKSK